MEWHWTLSSVPGMRLNYIFNYSYIDNENESYFTYSLYNCEIPSKFIMDVSGQIKQLLWLTSLDDGIYSGLNHRNNVMFTPIVGLLEFATMLIHPAIA
ncbi:hypothetical protein RDI58_017419 [Solanum bulbocastanum]|uniref:S-locus glycoprotein domain-containing protein n=1 Tax=Solanum bulbocastanum TaxID=147425 RepID=A0AAN8T9H2_SOLBU